MLWFGLLTLVEKPSDDVFEKASQILKKGGLVAFPTETVYGLGADALNEKAVKKIYEAKGRPSDNPLIVHISDINELYPLVEEVSPKAQKLIDSFWPGPMTLIFKKTALIPYATSGGLDTVAVRFPSDKNAQALIKTAHCPIAAPSANSSGKPSPTKASHVINDLDGKIDMIIDGGNVYYGLESTIIDVSGDDICLLRPGSITKEMIESKIGSISVDKAVSEKLENGEKPKAPGMKYRHYSPSADVLIVSGEEKAVSDKINSLYDGCRVKKCIIATEETKNLYNGNIIIIGSRKKPYTIAANLFDVLRQCDISGIEQVYCEGFNESDIGLAIMNRLKKAAGYNIIYV